MNRTLLLIALTLLTPLSHAQDKIKTLLIDGQNNHDWKKTPPLLKAALESANLFAVEVATSPAKGQDMSAFKPDFSKYQLVVSNYNGDPWSPATQSAFESF